jgi:hypothetical protein
MAKPEKGWRDYHPLIMAYSGIGVGRCPPLMADSEVKGKWSL